MKLLGYCLLCLFAARVQPKPQLTKLFPVEGLMMNDRQLNNTTKPLDRFLEKLRATYNFVFRQSNNTSNVERILAKNAPNPDLQTLKLIWTNSIKVDNNSTSLTYPENSLLDQVISLSTLKNYETKANSSLQKDSSVEIKSTIKANESNASSSEKSPNNKTKTLADDDDWFKDVPPLGQLELQDEELDNKNEVEIVTPGTTLQFPTTVGRHLAEWLAALFGLTHRIFTKLSGVACNSGNAIK